MGTVLNFKKLELTDKPLFDNYFTKYSQDSSELTFTNLFVFNDSKEIEFTEFEDHLIISFFNKLGDDKIARHFFQPIGKNPEIIISKILEIYPNTLFERVSKKIISNFENFNIQDDRANYDYIYKIEDLVLFAGKNYAPKRNFVNQFLKNNPTIRIIDNSIISQCLKLEEVWCDLKSCKKDKSLCAEYLAIKNAFDNYEKLNLFGVAVIVDEKVVGFAVGEKLNHDTFVEHFEKASDEYVGVYQFLLNQFAKEISKQFTNIVYLNREQDLGIEGMRKAKLSYHPVNMIEKVLIKKKN